MRFQEYGNSLSFSLWMEKYCLLHTRFKKHGVVVSLCQTHTLYKLIVTGWQLVVLLGFLHKNSQNTVEKEYPK